MTPDEVRTYVKMMKEEGILLLKVTTTHGELELHIQPHSGDEPLRTDPVSADDEDDMLYASVSGGKPVPLK